MGNGPDYDWKQGYESRSTNSDHFGHHKETESKKPEERGVHELMNPKGKIRECCILPGEHPNPTPIAILMDVTRSRGGDARTIFKKVPDVLKMIQEHNLLPDPEVCFGAIGDATVDKAPFQIGQFETDNRMDEDLGRLWLEKGGGGTGEESYELAAYFMARRTSLEFEKEGSKGILFILGDEVFYPEVKREEVKSVLGVDIPENIPSEEIFTELQEKFDVFFIFPKQSVEDRKADIDEEIKQRLIEAGGRFDDVDVRASLIWHNRNDLDLHVVTPAGREIFYGDPKSPCGGELDVDRNVHGETTKPVENIRWATGDANRGNYRVFVRNYGFHESPTEDTPFKVEVEINGKIETFEGVAKANIKGPSSDVEVGTFHFDPEARPSSEKGKYDAYENKHIISTWEKVLPSERILVISDPDEAAEVITGAIALLSGVKDLDSFMIDIKEANENLSTEKLEEIKETLEPFSQTVIDGSLNFPVPAGEDVASEKSGNSSLL
jgi:hypothetical protein